MKYAPINIHRGELMGIGAIGVLCVHSCQMIVWHPLLHKLFSYGGVGVYLFMFLSGIGWYYSLEKINQLNQGGGKIFYSRRAKRILIPYCLIAGVWYAIKDLFVGHNILLFFYELSTLSFWIEHTGAWYIALLIPLCLCYPFYFNWIENGKRGFRTCCVLLGIFIIQIIFWYTNTTLYEHLSQVINSLWVFVLGHYYGPKIKKQGYCLELMIPFIFLFLGTHIEVLTKAYPIVDVYYSYTGIVLAVTAAIFLEFTKKITPQIVTRVLKFCGSISLELYLTNIFLMHSMDLFCWNTYFDNLYIKYLIVIIVGFILSYIFTQVSKKIQSIMI